MRRYIESRFCLVIFAVTLLKYSTFGAEFPNYLKASLFSKVPPYLKFCSSSKNVSNPPSPQIRSHLSWPGSFGQRKELHDKTITNSGYSVVPRKDVHRAGPKLMGWFIKPSKRFSVKTLSFHKTSSFPSLASLISYRDGLKRVQQQFSKKHPNYVMPFVLPSYILPDEMHSFRLAWEKEEDKLWISKSPKSSCSREIKMLRHWREFFGGKGKVVVQKYVHNPVLYKNLKVELKHTFLVTSVHPLRIYSHPGTLITMVAKSNYSTSIEDLTNICVHGRPKYINCDRGDFMESLSHDSFLEMMTELNTKYNLDRLVFSMNEAIILTLLSAEHNLSKSFYKKAKNRYNYFQILSADFMLDESGHPWLMEINSSPLRSLRRDWRRHTNHDFYSEMLNIAGYHLPPHLSSELQDELRNTSKLQFTEKLVLDESLYQIHLTPSQVEKHLKYHNVSERKLYLSTILENLTSDDVRMLMITEDELNRVNVARRIFPTRSISKHIPLIESSTYYYKLLDAWETKYSHSRSLGRSLLENLSKSIL